MEVNSQGRVKPHRPSQAQVIFHRIRHAGPLWPFVCLHKGQRRAVDRWRWSGPGPAAGLQTLAAKCEGWSPACHLSHPHLPQWRSTITFLLCGGDILCAWYWSLLFWQVLNETGQLWVLKSRRLYIFQKRSRTGSSPLSLGDFPKCRWPTRIILEVSWLGAFNNKQQKSGGFERPGKSRAYVSFPHSNRAKDGLSGPPCSHLILQNQSWYPAALC